MLILGQKSCFLGPTIFHNRTDITVFKRQSTGVSFEYFGQKVLLFRTQPACYAKINIHYLPCIRGISNPSFFILSRYFVIPIETEFIALWPRQALAAHDFLWPLAEVKQRANVMKRIKARPCIFKFNLQ